jgi:hypothetical protein
LVHGLGALTAKDAETTKAYAIPPLNAILDMEDIDPRRLTAVVDVLNELVGWPMFLYVAESHFDILMTVHAFTLAQASMFKFCRELL